MIRQTGIGTADTFWTTCPAAGCAYNDGKGRGKGAENEIFRNQCGGRASPIRSAGVNTAKMRAERAERKYGRDPPSGWMKN